MLLRILGGFDAGGGRYILDLDLLQDASRLNFASPRLVIFEDGNASSNAELQRALVLLLCALLSATGLYMMRRPTIEQRRQLRRTLATGYIFTQPGPAPVETAMVRVTSKLVRKGYGLKPRPPKGRMQPRMSTVSLALVNTWLLVGVPVWVFETWTHLYPHGHANTHPFRHHHSSRRARRVA